jgi:hypothetical protein
MAAVRDAPKEFLPDAGSIGLVESAGILPGTGFQAHGIGPCSLAINHYDK